MVTKKQMTKKRVDAIIEILEAEGLLSAEEAKELLESQEYKKASKIARNHRKRRNEPPSAKDKLK